jgi:hypothetical protein
MIAAECRLDCAGLARPSEERSWARGVGPDNASEDLPCVEKDRGPLPTRINVRGLRRSFGTGRGPCP